MLLLFNIDYWGESKRGVRRKLFLTFLLKDNKSLSFQRIQQTFPKPLWYGGALIRVAHQGKHVMDTARAPAFHMWTPAEQNLLFSHLQQDLECKQAPSADGDWSAETVV